MYIVLDIAELFLSEPRPRVTAAVRVIYYITTALFFYIISTKFQERQRGTGKTHLDEPSLEGWKNIYYRMYW